MKKLPFCYEWWFIILCFISVYGIPLGVLFLFLKARYLSQKVSVYETDIDQITQAAIDEAATLRLNAQAESEEILKKAHEFEQTLNRREDGIAQKYAYVREKEKTAEEIVDQAQMKADVMLDDANRKCLNLKALIQALKNQREGYGDDYLLLGSTLLDDLAEHFGFSNASEEYKKAKDHSNQLIKDEKAAACDYVERVRKTTACAFVVDAFNGKVDTAIAKVKGGENFGKCRQAIKDAFAVVNVNGEAFRNARITEDYLQARLQELRWATVLLELKKREKQEQREIRERMREEAKAQAEFEKAKTQAAKEEKRLRAMHEKMQAALEAATDLQRSKYEAKLKELTEKLAVAQDNAKRTQAMAELTKAGHVYIISNIGSFGENVFKIGMTRRLTPEDRISELSNASVPFPFDIHAMIYSENAPELENKLHEIFDRQRVNLVNPRKEFFRVALSKIEAEVEKLGLQVNFTLLARAEEYRESLKRLPSAA